MSEIVTYSVPGLHCGHCTRAVERELVGVPGVEAAHADLETKLVAVTGCGVSDDAVFAAIAEAGYTASRT